MIYLRFRGRMGNQMFQYAFGLAMAQRLDTSLVTASFGSLKYFSLYPKNLIKNAIRKIGVKINKPHTQNYEDSTLTAEQLIPLIPKHVSLTGYFQSDRYFRDHEQAVRDAFTILPCYQKAFLPIQKTMLSQNKTTIAVHLRRTDYLSINQPELGSNGLVLPHSYYKKALGLFGDLSNYSIYFVSDDIVYAKEQFGQRSNYFFVHESEILDFQLLMHADHIVLSNSTFAWWAGFLGERANRRVISPKYWLGFKAGREVPPQITRENWEQVCVSPERCL